MAKNSNPADAFRKAQRKKELKKNKVDRQKKREFALVKKDTTEIEDEIAELEAVAAPTPVQKARLSELKSEIADINKKKEEYVEEHPEQRNLVYAASRRRQREKEAAERTTEAQMQPTKKTRSKFDKNGLPRHPERSIYYDPIMNPYGVPPPGMPYAERPLLPGEVDSDAEPEDEDIPLPKGPPPPKLGHLLGEPVTEDDDIPMPEGPPGQIIDEEVPLPPGPPPTAPPAAIPSLPPTANHPGPSPLPVGLPPAPFPGPFPPPPPGMLGMPPMPPFPPPPGFSFPHGVSPPPPPPGFPLAPGIGVPPPPPPGFGFPPNLPLPPPPPGFFPRKRGAQSTSSVQDPLSDIPHETFQAHRENRAQHGGSSMASTSTLPSNPNLPPKPVAAIAEAVTAAATITAEPELRDFKKESTAFVPAALKRKRAAAASSTGGGRINAAPSVAPEAGETEEGTSVATPRPDLMDALKQKLGPMASASAGTEGSTAKKAKVDKPLDDYEKFRAEMGDLLGPAA